MDKYSMKNQLTNEMANCRKCKVKRDRIHTNIKLPESIIELICSFIRCKRCSKTIELMKNEPQDLHKYQIKVYYFVNINPFPSRKTINKTVEAMGMDVFHQLLNMDEEKSLIPKQCNKYKHYLYAYQNLFTGQKIKPHTHKNKIAVFVDMMFSQFPEKIIYPKLFGQDFRNYLSRHIDRLRYDFS